MRFVALSTPQYNTMKSLVKISNQKLSKRFATFSSFDKLRHDCTNYDELRKTSSEIKELCNLYGEDTVISYLKLFINNKIAYSLLYYSRRQLDEHTQQVEELDIRITDLEDSEKRHIVKLDAANKRIDQISEENKRLQKQIDILVRNDEAFNSEISRLKSINSVLSDELQELKNENDTLNTEIAQLKSENSGLYARISTLEADNAMLKAQVVDLEAQVVDLKASNAVLEGQVVDLEAQVVDLEAQVVDLEAQVVDLEAQVVDLGASNAVLGAQVVSIQEEVQDIKKNLCFSTKDFEEVEVSNVREAAEVKAKVQRVIGLKVLQLHHLVVATPANSTSHHVRVKQLSEWITALNVALGRCKEFVDVSCEMAMLSFVEGNTPTTEVSKTKTKTKRGFGMFSLVS